TNLFNFSSTTAYDNIYTLSYTTLFRSGSAFITRSASTRAWAIAHRAKPTKQNARGYVDDRLRRPAAPSPTFPPAQPPTIGLILTDRKSTRLNSSHRTISYAVFCLKKTN